MKKFLFSLVMLSCYCISGFTQSQTRTATFLNNLNNFRDSYGDMGYPRANAEDVSRDDGIYAITRKLTSKGISKTSLALQGFGFSIPDNATIGNISVKVRRFKNGRPSIGDEVLSLMQRYNCDTQDPCKYGIFWTFQDPYDGKTYPDTETEYIFSQSGSGNNGELNHDESYEWTPAIVNHQYFGVRIDNTAPIGKGTVVVYYDLVEVTIDYVLPGNLRKSPAPVADTDVKLLKAPFIYPNPFTTKSNIQFTAAENGKAVVELYNISGVKLQTLFSGHVVKGQVYYITIGEAQLPKGIHIYRISNGKHKYTGRIIKLDQ